jgi:hypothetical protein
MATVRGHMVRYILLMYERVRQDGLLDLPSSSILLSGSIYTRAG